MKIKKFVAIALVFIFVVSCAGAEGNEGNIFDSIGGWFGQAWEDSSKWVSQAYEDSSNWVNQAITDASSWVNTAWGDASKWVNQAWNDTSKWATDIWGDVSTWSSQQLDAVSAWWIESFDNVAKFQKHAWDWIDSEKDTTLTLLTEKYKQIKSSVLDDASDAVEEVTKVYEEPLKDLGMNDGDITRIVQSIKAYADQKGLTFSSVAKIMLPYLIKLVADSTDNGNVSIPAIAIAQYLTGLLESSGISTDDQANKLITDLELKLKLN